MLRGWKELVLVSLSLLPYKLYHVLRNDDGTFALGPLSISAGNRLPPSTVHQLFGVIGTKLLSILFLDSRNDIMILKFWLNYRILSEFYILESYFLELIGEITRIQRVAAWLFFFGSLCLFQFNYLLVKGLGAIHCGLGQTQLRHFLQTRSHLNFWV